MLTSMLVILLLVVVVAVLDVAPILDRVTGVACIGILLKFAEFIDDDDDERDDEAVRALKPPLMPVPVAPVLICRLLAFSMGSGGDEAEFRIELDVFKLAGLI